MERLTFEGNFCDIARCAALPCSGTCSQKEVWERLKAYEDTGLTPGQAQMMRWIPIEERLPSSEYGESDNVLVCTASGSIHLLYWDGGNWCRPTGEAHWVDPLNRESCKITHWMPLPEPPEVSDNG